MRYVALACLAMTMMAGNSLLTRAGVLAGTDPLAFAAIRVAAGAAMLALLVRGRVPLKGRLGPAVALAVYLVGFSLAYRTLDAGLGALILFATVQLALLGAGLAKGETMSVRRGAGMALALVGMVWLLWPGDRVDFALLDGALMIAAGLGWAAYSYAGKYATDPLGANAGSFLLAAAGFALALPLWWDAPITVRGAVLASISGAITSGIGYAILYRVLPRLGLAAAGVAQLSVPVIAMILGALILAELPSARALAAGCLTLVGIALATLQGTIRSKGS
ncbi:DMT family transporter [Jannaschia aquimarina]|uniref:EamA-like transporter family protein n=1 Tax=Jannaschia aquimarina TaxID=935700 RepID=A0A0D1EKG5_9RHOB|nr:DMT family transporter [Jannaschia aquimarina]KIT17516.1 EamA-like transporter family protein [Jannaschia aquimarina]SNS73969.1 EamA-like transporter family protein [Jannaschia aquimarina]